MGLGVIAGLGGGAERLVDQGRGHDRIALAVIAGLADGEAELAIGFLTEIRKGRTGTGERVL